MASRSQTQTSRKWRLSLMAALLCGLSACSGNEAPAETARPQAMPDTVTYATQDLAQRLDLPVGEISLVRKSDVTWSDGSLGCPRKGMMYTQALVPGMQIIFEAGGRHYAYHAAAGDQPFLCENPRPPAAVNRNE